MNIVYLRCDQISFRFTSTATTNHGGNLLSWNFKFGSPLLFLRSEIILDAETGNPFIGCDTVAETLL